MRLKVREAKSLGKLTSATQRPTPLQAGQADRFRESLQRRVGETPSIGLTIGMNIRRYSGENPSVQCYSSLVDLQELVSDQMWYACHNMQGRFMRGFS